jgi:hypothetical protein
VGTAHNCIATYGHDIVLFSRLLQVRLAAAVGQQRRMSRDAAALFTEGAPGEVVLPDCTRLEPGALAAALQDCATPRCDLVCHSILTTSQTRSAHWSWACRAPPRCRTAPRPGVTGPAR